MRKTVALAMLVAAIPAQARVDGTITQLRRHFDHACDDDKLSHVEQSSCLSNAVRRMKVRLTAEYEKALAAADGDALTEQIGGRSAAERARRERANLVNAQRTWEAYKSAECFRITEDIDLGGGNSADVAGASCELDHMAQRILELQP